MGIKVVGKFDPHEACIMGKARQHNFNMIAVEHSMIPGVCLYLDISSPNTDSLIGKRYASLVVDDATSFVGNFFLKNKSDLKESILELTCNLKTSRKKVKYICCNDVAENKPVIKFEHTAHFTPQHNGKVERKFTMMYGKVWAMINDAKLMVGLCKKLCAQTANTATLLENRLRQSDSNTEKNLWCFGKGVTSLVQPIKKCKICIITNHMQLKKN